MPFGRQTDLVVVHVIADDLHAGIVHRCADCAAQHIEVAVDIRIRLQVHARLDHGFAAALRTEAGLDRFKQLIVGDPERLDIRTVQVGDVDWPHSAPRVRRVG